VRAFYGGAEIRITKEDLMQMLEKTMEDSILSFSMHPHKVTDVSLHPDNKYVLRMRLEPHERGK